MNKSFLRRRALPLIALTLVMLGLCSHVQASTITYTFSQGGFLDGAGDIGTLTGAFTGNPEANGTFQLHDLTSFNATFSENVNGTPNSFLFNTPNDFSYDPNTPGSLSFSSGSTQSGIVACTGSADVNAVCLGLNQPMQPRSSAKGFFEDLPNFGSSTTQQVAVVNLSSGPGSATPEPGSSVLVLTGAALLFIGTFRRRKTAQRVNAMVFSKRPLTARSHSANWPNAVLPLLAAGSPAAPRPSHNRN